MLFSTGTFWLFFPVVFALLATNRWLLRSVPVQNGIILGASYVFYGWWDWRFLGLIAVSTLLDYVAAIGMESTRRQSVRRRWLHLSVVGNLGILGYFKYFDFFGNELKSALVAIGFDARWGTLDIILPVGISFYTLQTLSYSIDVYHGRFRAERNLLRYATYVAFFPQLVAGPIERAKDLIPQFGKLERFSWPSAYQGVCLIIAGLFLKIVLADNLAPYVDGIFASYTSYNGGELALGGLYFTIQIYADFCGYSSIAIGLAALMGFRLSTNFDTPFFARSITDFWRRWHITLSLFLRDYVYIPTSGATRVFWKANLAAILTFLVSGLWHGANWTFLAWGLAHGILLVFERLWHRRFAMRPSPLISIIAWAYTFGAVALLFVIFRSPNISVAADYLARIVTDPALPHAQRGGMVFVVGWLAVDLLWRGRTRLDRGLNLAWLGAIPRAAVETVLFALALILVLVNAANRTDPSAFIYFQF
ncbi:MBOAT family O-acyltransferase [Pseudoblastomonas halimionae]|uniref:Probable alginate O-acetylase AlgI n=1 Tax=Alteriqipengyuania halimionae TaxID=1926630 RepID=A0A6I4U4I2_9SPHN|nr:MBOAT family O-acyltransferase [Alteriqipengyuania halimionae]MXP10910.1 MBOAT family protein [Alteriqipengyuania halimionae]